MEIILTDDTSDYTFYPKTIEEYGKLIWGMEIYYNQPDFDKIFKDIFHDFIIDTTNTCEYLSTKEKNKRKSFIRKLDTTIMTLRELIHEMQKYGVDECYYEEFYWSPEKMTEDMIRERNLNNDNKFMRIEKKISTH